MPPLPCLDLIYAVLCCAVDVLSDPPFYFIVFFNFSIVQQFERYFAANDVNKQGSFYLQSKIYRAHEMLKEFQEEKRREDIASDDKENSSSSKQ
jgi:hypothetical protein